MEDPDEAKTTKKGDGVSVGHRGTFLVGLPSFLVPFGLGQKELELHDLICVCQTPLF